MDEKRAALFSATMHKSEEENQVLRKDKSLKL